MIADSAHLATADDGSAFRWLNQAGDQLEDGRLAAATGANEGDEIALVDAQTCIVQRDHIAAITHGHVRQFDHGSGRGG